MISGRTFLITAAVAGGFVASGVGSYFAVKSNVSTPTDTPVAAAERTWSSETASLSSSAATPAGTAASVTPSAAELVDRTPSRQVAARPNPRAETRKAPALAPAAELVESPAPPSQPATENVPAAVEALSIAPEPPPAVTPVPTTRELTIPNNSVIGIRLERGVSSETAKVEDRVVARVTRDVRIDDTLAIPAGARLEGHVTLVERGGRFKEQARIGVQFLTLVVDDARIRIQTEAIMREGDGPAKEATAKIGASAVVGTILGAVIGGGKGAAIGGAAGAAGGGAAVAAGGRSEAKIPDGASLTVRLTEPVVVTVSRE